MSEIEHSLKTDSNKSSDSTSTNLHSPEEHPNALWQDAYEHKKEIAAATIAVTAAGLAFAAKRTPIGRMLGLSKDVLVIEDTSIFSHCIKSSLEAQGEKVTVIKGVESLKPFVGILEDGSTKRLNLYSFRSAFLDGNLEGKLHGPDIISTLRDKNVFTVAMSSEANINDTMTGLGANLAAQKSVVMQSLKFDDLKLPQAIRQPNEAQRRLNDLRDHFSDPDQALKRKEMEKQMMTKFAQEEAKKTLPQTKSGTF